MDNFPKPMNDIPVIDKNQIKNTENQFCDCLADGFCNRYGREMLGRFRQICRGENVDAGTAAAFRAYWLSEKNGNLASLTPPTKKPERRNEARPIILRNHLQMGDALVMTAAIYSLHRENPGMFLTAVETPHAAIFENNPDVVSLDLANQLGAETIETHYPAIHDADRRGIHFMQAYCEHFAASLNVSVPLLTNRPHVYLSDTEKKLASFSEMPWHPKLNGKQTWLVNCGVTKALTCKEWGTNHYQKVVDSLAGKVIFVQVGSEKDKHPHLENVLNIVGKTTLRELIVLANRADGVLSGVTFLQHLAAAFEKPAVVVIGGREPVQWNTYPKQQLLHTIGSLPCCENKACWKSRVVALNDEAIEDKSLCEMPTLSSGETIPKCMTLISPEEVIEKILRYSS